MRVKRLARLFIQGSFLLFIFLIVFWNVSQLLRQPRPISPPPLSAQRDGGPLVPERADGKSPGFDPWHGKKTGELKMGAEGESEQSQAKVPEGKRNKWGPSSRYGRMQSVLHAKAGKSAAGGEVRGSWQQNRYRHMQHRPSEGDRAGAQGRSAWTRDSRYGQMQGIRAAPTSSAQAVDTGLAKGHAATLGEKTTAADPGSAGQVSARKSGVPTVLLRNGGKDFMQAPRRGEAAGRSRKGGRGTETGARAVGGKLLTMDDLIRRQEQLALTFGPGAPPGGEVKQRSTPWAHLNTSSSLQGALVSLVVLQGRGRLPSTLPWGPKVLLAADPGNASVTRCDTCYVVTSKVANALTSYFSTLDLQENQRSLLAAVLGVTQLVVATRASGALISHSAINHTAQLQTLRPDPITSGVIFSGNETFDAEKFYWGPEAFSPPSLKSSHWFRLGDPGNVLIREAFPSSLPCMRRLSAEKSSHATASETFNISGSLTSKILSAVRDKLLPNAPKPQTLGAGGSKPPSRLLDVRSRTFDPHAPSVFLSRGSFATLALQNAFLQYDALWALIARCAMASSPKPEVWGLWVQRLLWELNASVMVTQPQLSSRQRDAERGGPGPWETEAVWAGNADVASRSGAWLLSWTCPRKHGLDGCLLSLSEAMQRKGFLTAIEYQLVTKWVSVLKEIGYRFPARDPKSRSITRKDRVYPSFVEFVPALIRNKGGCHRTPSLVERIQSLGEKVKSAFAEESQGAGTQLPSEGEAAEGESAGRRSPGPVLGPSPDLLPESHLPNPFFPLCGQAAPESYSQAAGLNSDILLLVILSNKVLYSNIAYLDFMYRRHFANVIYCADFDSEFQAHRHLLPREVSFVEASMELGFFQYNCSAQVLRMNFKVKGHLAIRDDLLLNPWHVASLPRDKPWWQPELVFAKRTDSTVSIRQHVRDPWPEWRGPYGVRSLAKAWADFSFVLGGKSEQERAFLQTFLANLARSTGSDLGVACETSDTFYLPDSLKEEFLYLTEIFDRHKTYLEIAIPTMLTGMVGVDNLHRMPGLYLWGDDRRSYRQKFDQNLLFIHPVKMYKMEKDKEKISFFCKKYLPLIEADLNKAVEL